MTKYREILRLHSQGVSQRVIASSCQCSRNTVSSVLERERRAIVSHGLSEKTRVTPYSGRNPFPRKESPIAAKTA